MEGLTGIKVGMTRYFTTEGIAVPVTLIKIEPHRITQIKTLKTDGYYAIQVTSGIKKRSRVLKPEAGHFVKSGIEVGKRLWEFRYAINSNNNKNLVKVGDLMTVSLFSAIQKVDITGISKGKGFSGTIKRWNFHSQDASHGNSLSHRAPGSIGQNQTPGRVFKGKKMAGQLGNIRVTIQNLDVMHVDVENNVLLVKGSIPGEIDSVVRVRISVKKRG